MARYTTISIPPKPVKKRKEGHHPADVSSLLKETKNQTPNKPLLFFPNLKTIADLHIHSILEDIVTFFDHPISESQDSSTILINPKSSLQDPQVQKSRKRWLKLREDLAQVLLAAQYSYIHCCEDSDHPDVGLGVEEDFFNHPVHINQSIIGYVLFFE
jgi:hypothetical protein